MSQTSVLVIRAAQFAIDLHRNQRRKYTQELYHYHCQHVAEIVASVNDDPELISAAWLHDTLEDTQTTEQELWVTFGPKVTEWVREVTEVWVMGNRAFRKMKECERLAQVSPEAQTIKLADLIDNTPSIVENDPRFAKVYLQEKAALLQVLRKGDMTLQQKAQQVLADAMARHEIRSDEHKEKA